MDGGNFEAEDDTRLSDWHINKVKDVVALAYHSCIDNHLKDVIKGAAAPLVIAQAEKRTSETMDRLKWLLRIRSEMGPNQL